MTTVHCYADCQHKDRKTDICQKSDIIIAATGCRIHNGSGVLSDADIKIITDMSVKIAQQSAFTQQNIYDVANMIAMEMLRARTGAIV